MKLILDGHDFGYEMGNLCFLFFPGEKVETLTAGGEPEGDYVRARLKRTHAGTFAFVTLRRGGVRARRAEKAPNGGAQPLDCETALGRAFYRAAEALTGIRPPWGILTGIRPARLVRGMTENGASPAQAERILTEERLVSPEKARLAVATAQLEEEITARSRPESMSLYIAIPFCPTRCLYCSFISHDLHKSAKLLPQYIERLCREIAETGALARRLGLRLESVYIGGGTPTSLSEQQLESVLSAVKEHFNLEQAAEYTVEAGRPDTVTAGKLRAIRAGGATRVCINPQTLDDAILERIGRSHTARQFFQAFDLARAAGIPSINTDLIAGLPGDTPEGFARTLDGVLSLRPEGVTVHTLALKRSSRLVTEGAAVYDPRGDGVQRMLAHAYDRLTGAGCRPYYLYRQRNTAGNLENVGYALPGHEGLYNIYIMDETHTILSAGAGGVTKLRQPGGSRIERIFNFKYPYEYISRFGEILDRKKQVEKFYDDNGWKS